MRNAARKTEKPQRARPLKRLLHFGDEVWSYQVASGVVLIRLPDLSMTFTICLPEIVGMSYETIEKGLWKRWWHGVGPGEVKAYIDGHLRGPDIVVPDTVYLPVSPHWEPERWHLFSSCSLLFRLAQPFARDAAQETLGFKLTQRNLCGACRIRRDQNPKEM